jgi:kynurenine formamidase
MHLDAPGHFSAGGRMTDELAAEDLVRPVVVLDVRAHCAGDPAYALSRAEVEEAEDRDGAIPAGSAVLVCTGWDAYVGDRTRYAGDGATPDFPGIAPAAAELFVERGVAGIGIDTLGVDPGRAVDFPVHRITQRAGMWHLEGAVNIHRVPARGAWLVVGALPVVECSGCPMVPCRRAAAIARAPQAPYSTGAPRRSRRNGTSGRRRGRTRRPSRRAASRRLRSDRGPSSRMRRAPRNRVPRR